MIGLFLWNATNHPIFSEGVNDKSQFIMSNQLNMEKILEKFVLHFNDIYGTQPDKFKEDDGRKLIFAVSATNYQWNRELLY